jgi:arsenite methyltransferase
MLAERLGYTADELSGVPDAAIDSFCGAARPFELGAVREGETVLDIGCGSGLDLLIAARQAGPAGRGIGVDFCEEMARTAEEAARQSRIVTVEIRRGDAMALPVEDESVDVVLANGVVNHLCPDKAAVLAEAYRVLRAGGRLLLGDMAVGIGMPPEVREIVDLWTT